MSLAAWQQAAHEIASSALGRDPGPLDLVSSLSHRVFVGSDVVVKLTECHTRLDREIALSPELPDGITAPLLASGRQLGMRYACYERVRGASPGSHLPHTDAVTARVLAVQAVERLVRLHAWVPTSPATEVLRQPLAHGGFSSREALWGEIDRLQVADRGGMVSRRILAGLRTIADRATVRPGVGVPVHGDCAWDNWLADGATVTALLDFEWARFGDPIDDWFFLIRFSGPHAAITLEVASEATEASEEVLRGECEIREASYVTTDVRRSLENGADAGIGTIGDLEQLVTGRYWWRDSVT